MIDSPVDQNLARVLVTLVEKCGMKNMLITLAGIAYTKSIEMIAEEPASSDKWKLVGAGLERFARTRLRGLK